ncbi:MAG TPA: DUF6165 family protein [Azospirillum sp.]|nr:DUF6165 family protein [Azospirillum sp.]
MSADSILVPVSFGEVVDKITILRIKSVKMTDAAKLANVRNELALLEDVLAAHRPQDEAAFDRLVEDLYQVNATLWAIEDDIRDCERRKTFDDAFVALARSVYRQNDRRAELKREINLLVGSGLLEEKSYAAY